MAIGVSIAIHLQVIYPDPSFADAQPLYAHWWLWKISLIFLGQARFPFVKDAIPALTLYRLSILRHARLCAYSQDQHSSCDPSFVSGSSRNRALGTLAFMDDLYFTFTVFRGNLGSAPTAKWNHGLVAHRLWRAMNLRYSAFSTAPLYSRSPLCLILDVGFLTAKRI